MGWLSTAQPIDKAKKNHTQPTLLLWDESNAVVPQHLKPNPTIVCKGHIRPEVLWTISMMLLNERNDVGAKDSAVDLPIDRVIRNGGKNTPLCHVDCTG